MPDAVIVLDHDGCITLINTQTEEMFGYSLEELMGEPIEILVPERFKKGHATVRSSYLAAPTVRSMGDGLNIYGRRKDGSEFPVDISLAPVETDDISGVLSVIHDITARKQAEEISLRLSAIVESSDDAIIGVTLEGMIQSWNRGAERLYGYSAEEVLGQPLALLVPPNRLDEIREVLNKIRRGEATESLETVRRHKDGRDLHVSITVSALRDSTGQLIGASGIARDITERKQMAETLAAEKELLRVTLHSIGDGVITTDIEGKILAINKVAEEITGWPQAEAIGIPLHEVFHIINELTRERCRSPFDKIIKTGRIVGLANHTVLIARDGTEKILADSGAPIRDNSGRIIGVVLVFRDETQKRTMQVELLKASKLESIGVIAGGIAHDFNNFLTGILGNISLAKMLANPEDDVFQRLVEAEKAAELAKDLPQQLLTFSKGGTPVKRTAALSEIIQASVNFSLSGSNVGGQWTFPEDLWLIQADSGQLNQVFNNLIINAVQAMPQGGTIQIRGENVVLRQGEIGPLKRGEYVKVVIQDQGIGIPREHLQRIFDPFFTTKQKGSGLGMTTAYSIIKSHGGFITVESELGGGTAFSLFLPASTQAVIIKKRKAAEVSSVGLGKILVMDDEEVVRDLIKQILVRAGHEVEFAEHGQEAITLFRQAKETGHPFDVVIMDLTIRGGMGGEEAIQKLLKIDPTVKAIVSSGYTDKPVMAHYRQYGFSGMVTKPYQPAELCRIVNTVLMDIRE